VSQEYFFRPATQKPKRGLRSGSRWFARGSARPGNAAQLHDQAFQALAMGVRMGGWVIAIQSVFEFELDEQVEFVGIQDAVADGAVEEMAQEDKPFERIAGTIEIERFGIRVKDQGTRFMLGPLEGSALDAPRKGEAEIILSGLKLPRVEKAQ
jgi:hypothetical protein